MIKEFKKWLDEEIKDTELNPDRILTPGRLFESKRIRQKYCEEDIRHRNRIEEIITQICNHYCKFPEAYGDKPVDQKRMEEERCDNCPLKELK